MQKLAYNRYNVLISFAYIRGGRKFYRLIEAIGPYCNILVDSGAYTIFKESFKLHLTGKAAPDGEAYFRDYISACAEFSQYVWNYIALDIVRDPIGTRKNLQIMLDKGLLPMPVFQEKADQQELDFYLGIRRGRLCVAGGVQSNDHYIRHRYKSVFDLSGGTAKIHGLGFGRWPDIFRVPISSSDSSSYAVGSMYGNLVAYSRTKGFVQIHHSKLLKHGPGDAGDRLLILRHLIENCGIKEKDLRDASFMRTHVGIPHLVGQYAYLKFMQHCSETGRDYFVAAPSLELATSLISILYATNGDYFDYYAARDKRLELRELEPVDFDAALDFYATTLQFKTNQEVMPHSL